MRKHSILLVCVVVLIIGSAMSLQAQSADGVKAKIPFSFVVGQKVLPAGSYTVTRLGANSPDLARVVRSTDGRYTAIIIAGTSDQAAHGAPALIFHRYGDTYFLSSVRANSHSTLFRSATEEAKVAAKLRANPPAIIAAN